MFDWITQIITQAGYPGIFLLMLAENLFPPIPSEVIMPLAGFLIGEGKFALVPTILAGTAGAVCGTLFWYGVGLWLGAERLKSLASRWGRFMTVSPGDIDAARDWFDRHGGKAVFFGRMLPAIRTLISVPAGIARMPVGRFLALSTLGSLVWTAGLTVAGMVLQNQFQAVGSVIDILSKVIVALVVVIYLYRVITWKPH